MKLLRRLPRRVAILGCGPAGLFAAHAFFERGWGVDIYSRKRRSEMFGAQYLHQAIDGLSASTDWVNLTYELRGTNEGYAQKVYGHQEVDFVSPQQFLGGSVVWDIRAAYYRAWELYGTRVIDTNITPAYVKAMLDGEYRHVISSLPATNLCDNPSHQFSAQRVWSMGDAPERGQFCPVTVMKNMVVCDGTPDTGWYRASNIFGYSTVEWPESRKPPIPGVAEVLKPIATTCTCYDKWDKYVRVGRYGTWTKGTLSHHAFVTAQGLAER